MSSALFATHCLIYIYIYIYIYIRGGTVHVFVPNRHGTDMTVQCIRPYDEYRQFTPNPEGGARSNATLFDNRQQKNSECRELRTWKQSLRSLISVCMWMCPCIDVCVCVRERERADVPWMKLACCCPCYDPWHRCFRVFCFVYVSVYVCRDWLFITERDWWILKRVTLKGRRYQHMASSILAFAVMAWRAPDSAPSTDHQQLCGYCLWFILFILRKSFGA